jgi:hypothetical protein
MRKVYFIGVILFCINSAYAQQELMKEIKNQAVVIDSLNKAIKTDRDATITNTLQSQKILKSLQDSVSVLRIDLSRLVKFRAEKKIIDSQLKTKSDSISGLKNTILEKEKQIVLERNSCELKVKEEYRNGQKSSLASIFNTYKTKSLDDLIQSSTLESVKRDKALLENNTDLNQLFEDLIACFEAKELLKNRIDAAKAKSFQMKLGQIKNKSVVIEKLKSDIENYESFNSGLKESIGKLNVLDNKESVAGMSDDVQKMKYNKILSEISAFIFNYDFKFNDYPYLSDIVLEIFKRKQPNPDAEISDLMQKL